MAPRTEARLTVFLLAGLLALAGWWLSSGPPASTVGDPAPIVVVEASATPGEALPPLQRVASRRKPVRCEDRLSGEVLDVAVTVRAGGDELTQLRSGERMDLSDLPLDSTLTYAVGSLRLEHSATLADCLRESEEHWLLSLPYSSRIEVELRGPVQPAAGDRGQIMICQDPRLVPEPQAPDGERGPYTLAGLDMSLEGLLHWRLRSGALKSWHKASFSAVEPAPLRVTEAGDCVLSLHFSSGASAVAPLRLIPGEVLRVPLELRARPSLRGRLLDWNGQPVPREKVVMTVALDLADYDLRPGDPHGLMAYRQEGVLTHTVKKTYVTGADGSFDLTLPRGREYAVYSYARGGYAFWSTLHGGAAPAAAMDVELRLAEPSAANCVAITVLQPDGQPLRAGTIDIGVAGDLPFFRQWPAGLALDESGSVTVAGMEPGMRVGVVIHHDSLTSGIYAPTYPTVSADRRIEVRLPELALNSRSR